MMAYFLKVFDALRAGLKRVPRPLMPVLVLGVALFGFALLVSTRPQTKPADITERVWAVAAQSATYAPYTPIVEAFGELQARRQVDLRAQVAGEVLATGVGFEEGALVAKGDVLLEIDPFDYRAALDETHAQLAGGKAMLAEQNAAVALAELDLARTAQLFEHGTLSQKTLDDRRTDLTIKQARRDQQMAMVERHKVALSRATRNLRDTKLLAPFDGHLGKINARAGRVLTPNDRVATLSDAHQFDVVFNLSDAEYGRFLARNSDMMTRKADVFWDIGGERFVLKAVVERVAAQISQTTRGVDVFARIEGVVPDILRSGAFVSIRLAAPPLANVIAIPKQAVYGDNLIYLIENGRLTPFRPDNAIDTGERLLVLRGIKEGAQILLTRFNEAAPGVAVQVAKGR